MSDRMSQQPGFKWLPMASCALHTGCAPSLSGHSISKFHSAATMSGDEDLYSYIPSWVNKKFVETVLNNGNEGPRLTVKIIKSDSACKKGMSSGSCLVRIFAAVRLGESATRELRSFMLKYGDNNDMSEGFEKEIVALSDVVPQAHRLLRSVEGEAFRPVAPLCHLIGGTPVPFVAIEDLSPAGFRTADAERPLDYQHCAAVVRAYARLHAASARVIKDHPHYKTLLDPKKYMTDDQRPFYRKLSDHMFKSLARQLKAHSGYERYAQKYEQLAEKFTNDFFNYWRSEEVRLPVMLHGDCFKYNFMFTYEDEKVTGVRLIDFQGSEVHSGATDLQHFLHRNASEEVLSKHVDALLADYHSTLVTLLCQLGMEAEAEAYTMDALLEDMQAASTVALFNSALSLMSLTAHKYAGEWLAFLDLADGSEELLEDAFRNPYYISCLKYLVPEFDKKGLL